MKNVMKFVATLLLGATAFASCEKEPEKVEPNFPEAIEKTVQSGETVEITFTPNYDWELSIPETALKYFYFAEGSERLPAVRGTGGAEATVTLKVAEITDFEDHSCEVSLTMDGKSKVIATYNYIAPVPVFPNGGEYAATAGETIALQFDANLDWTLSIPETVSDVFGFVQEGSEELVASISGAAGAVTANIKVTDTPIFEAKECPVTLAMANETKVIKTITLAAAERSIKIYPVKADETGYFETAINANNYESTASTSINMIFDTYEYSFATAFRIESNFNWKMNSYPEWVKVAGACKDEGEAGVDAYIHLLEVSAKLPLEGAKANLVFVDKDANIEVATIELNIQSLKEISIVEEKEYNFNVDGYTYNIMAGDWVQAPISTKLVAAEPFVAFAAEKRGGWYYTVGASQGTVESSNNAWVTFELSSADDEVALKEYTLRTSVSANTGAARTAELYVIPSSEIPANFDVNFDLYNSNGDKINAKFEKYYAGTIEQAGSDGPAGDVITPVADEAGLAAMGIIFEKADATDPMNSWINWVKSELGLTSDQVFQVTVNKNTEYSNPFLVTLAGGFGNYQVYNSDLEPLTYPNFMTEVMPYMGEQYMFSIWFEGEYNEEYIQIFNEAGDVSAIVRVVFDKNAEIGGGSLVSFLYPEMVSGASIRKLTEADGDLFWMYYGNLYITEIYELTYETENPQMAMIKVPEFGDYWLADETNDTWIQVEPGDGYVMISMNEVGKTGGVVFIDNSMGYPMPKFAIVCKRTN